MGTRLFSTFDLIYVHHGKLSLEISGNDVRLTKRGAVLIYPQTRFRGRCTSAAAVSSQHFTLTDEAVRRSVVFARLEECTNGFEVPKAALPFGAEHEINRAIRLASLEQTETVCEMRVAQLLLSLAEWEMKPPVVCGRFSHAADIARLARWMEVNLHKKITLQDMADQVGLSVSQFRSVFKELVGSSPAQFFHNIRMDAAKRMLLESSDAIKSIAQAVGFDDLSHFYRSFGRHSGKTPAEFRRMHLR